MLETIVALFVLTIGVGGVAAFVNRTLGSVQDPVARIEALYLAQEGIEIVRNIRDTNFAKVVAVEPVPDGWLTGLAGCGGGCEADYKSEALVAGVGNFLYRNSGGFYDYDDINGEETKFQRTIVVDPDGANPIRADVHVTVTWEYRGIPNEVSAFTHIYDWLE